VSARAHQFHGRSRSHPLGTCPDGDCERSGGGREKSSSKWIKAQGVEFAGFAWQAGYGAFAVSESNVPTVRDYIASQKEHHRQKSFQEEYRAFLERHGVAYDERYVWD